MKAQAWLMLAVGLVAGALLTTATLGSAAFGRFALQLCPVPGASVSQPAAEHGGPEGPWPAR